MIRDGHDLLHTSTEHTLERLLSPILHTTLLNETRTSTAAHVSRASCAPVPLRISFGGLFMEIYISTTSLLRTLY